MKQFMLGLACGLLFLAGGALAGNITAQGMNQADLYTYMVNIRDRVNSLHTVMNSVLTAIDATNATNDNANATATLRQNWGQGGINATNSLGDDLGLTGL